MSTIDNDWDEEYSVIGDKSDVGFLDFDDDKSFHCFNPCEDDGPVTITAPFPFVNGKPQSALIGETVADSISIRNITSEPVDLWSVRIFSSNPEDAYILSLMKPPSSDADERVARSFLGTTCLDDRVIQPGQTLMIWLSCKPKELGLHTGVVHFDLGDEKVERVVFLLADDQVSQALFSKRPYSRASNRGRRFNHDTYVAGSRPSRANAQVFKNKLPRFDIPPEIREMVETKQIPDVIMEGLNQQNYTKFFSTLIVMEEIHMEEEMRTHNMECVNMRRRGNIFLSLVIPDLAERRPSLVCGDYIFAHLANVAPGRDPRHYQGYIHRVEADEIFLKFDKELHARHNDNDLYNVSFTYNRISMRRQYQAVHAAEKLGPDLLFPSQSSNRRVIRTSSFVPLNPRLNREQVRSVEMILGCRGGPPYVIYGPPGTGKTITLVEAILQIYNTRERARILVCASSNSAADHVLDKLLTNTRVDVKESEIFRLNAPSRPYEDVKPDFIRFCFFNDMVFSCPPLKALLRYRIIISTYMSSSLLYAEGVKRGHFSVIFLDEAGQASEPETMVPISNLCMKETVIVLAGDPKQLGPVVYSRDAESYGLGKSYLDRLFECKYYEDKDENYVTKLVRNYRCHPVILELPSKLFYKGELMACKEDNDSFIYDSFDLPNKAFPVTFIGIQGCDEREGSSPSWFNRIEVSKVIEIIRKLMRCPDLGENDIGIITPYRQQVLKLKKALESVEMPDVKVGSVEQFQGQEMKVIIVSTVRSTVKHNKFDRVHNLGFLSSPRRFNVAITRAKSLLIIVGNPHIITKDPHWDKLLRYCADNGSYQGCPLPPPENHYYADEASGNGSGDHAAEVEKGADPPTQYFNKIESGVANPQPYSGEAEQGVGAPNQEWGGNSANQHNNEAEGGNDPSTRFSNKTDEEVAWGTADKAGRAEVYPKVKATGWDDDMVASRWSKDYPEVKATGWDDDLPTTFGWGEVSPEVKATGWDDDVAAASEWDNGSSSIWEDLPQPSNLHATGWDDQRPY